MNRLIFYTASTIKAPKMKQIIIACFLTILSEVKSFDFEPVIQIGNSKIIGQSVYFQDTAVYQFLSVPYAQPPLGQLRFQKPEPILNFPEVVYAVNIPPECHQYTENPFPWYDNSTYKSEDCLYLNIWTPSDVGPGNRKAVLYWIYGGGYKYGSIQQRLYSGVPLSALGDIIVVTVNYRVGPFGFLTSDTQEAPGNVALWDTLEGLKWINKYIGYFGGDTSRITIAGESVGGISVGLLAVSPLARGLFNGQIMQSGSPAYLAAENNTQNLAFSQQVAATVGCASSEFTIKEHPQQVVDCLKRLDPVVLAKADFILNRKRSASYFPQFGDEFLPENPRISILRGEFQCKKLLIGNTLDEGSVFLTMSNPEIFGFFGEKEPLINKTTGAEYIRKSFNTFPNPEAVVQYYLPDSVPENAYDFITHQTYTSVGDVLLLCPDVYYAEKCAEKGGQTYFYFWTHRPSITPWAPWMGVAHFTEVQFVFGMPFLDPFKYTQEEQQISLQVIEIWSSFIKDGKPSIPWPLYSKEQPFFKYLGPGITGMHDIGPYRDNCDFFRPFFTSD